MAYEMVMPYHLHMPSYFLETFTEYPILFYGEGHFMAHLQNRCEAITNIHYMYCL